MSFLPHISYTTATDQELVTLYREKGDLEVLGALYQRYMELVYGVCLKYLKDPEASKDAVMQIFEELITKLPRFEVTNFKSWLHVLSKNHCLMQLRSGKNKQTTELKEWDVQSEENLHHAGISEQETNLRIMEDCLTQLVADQQRTIRLFYLEEKSYKEIVELTGMDWNKVRSLVQNGRRNLRICMEKNNK